MQAVYIYCQTKTMMGKVIVESSEEQKEILLFIDALRMHVKKLDKYIAKLTKKTANLDLSSEEEEEEEEEFPAKEDEVITSN